jgi:hypothetical protein
LSPILVRPVREQLEHDRVIRLLQAKYKKKFEVAINPGSVQSTPVLVGTSPWYPDLVLMSSDRGRRPVGTIEVETAESVNHLEAMSQWATFSRLRAPLHLYVPTSSIDTAKRLCADLQIPVAEIWAFSAVGDQVRFALVHRSAKAEAASRSAESRSARSTAQPKARGRATPAKAAKARPAASRKSASRKPAAQSGPARRRSAGASKARKRK